MHEQATITKLNPSAYTDFDYTPRTRVVFGAGCLDQLGALASSLGARHALLVTDSGLRAAGHESRALELLRAASIEVTVFDEVTPNPTTEDVERCLAVARHIELDLIIGLGGGSSMDCAKGINFLLTNGGQMEDYWGVGKASKPLLLMIAVPTTAGTGSEAQSFAMIAQAKTHMKMACGDPKAACKIALLDPELTLSMPAAVTAATGVDAISHAVETYVTKTRNMISQLFSFQAWQLLSNGFPKVCKEGDDLTGRSAMLLGAHLAGVAIENSMLGASHALANPVTAHFGITHGIAVGIFLPHVIRYNSTVVGDLYGKLAAEVNLCENGDPTASELLASFITTLISDSGQPTSLAECDVDPDRFPELAEEASQQWTGRFNPRQVEATSLQELYQCALNPFA